MASAVEGTKGDTPITRSHAHTAATRIVYGWEGTAGAHISDSDTTWSHVYKSRAPSNTG